MVHVTLRSKLLLLAAFVSLGSTVLGFALQAKTKSDPAIRIVDASFGDQLNHKTCSPDLSLCKGLSTCKFTVGEMCSVDARVKNLEVTWDCGDGTEKHAKAAAKGTEISLECTEK